jgi:hypothetical protein
MRALPKRLGCKSACKRFHEVDNEIAESIIGDNIGTTTITMRKILTVSIPF